MQQTFDFDKQFQKIDSNKGESEQQNFTNQNVNIENQNNQSQTPNTKPLNPLKEFKNDVANSLATKNISDKIIENAIALMNNEQIQAPKGYNVGNELKLAYYKILAVKDVQLCTKDSIANALMECAIQGLSTQQNQCYFIKYGNSISLQRSYFGDIALLKRTGLVVDVYANVIYEGDIIETGFDEYGMECVIRHETKFGNQDNKIIGAYAVAVGVNKYKRYAIMTRRQLENNWKLSKSRQNSSFLNDFTEEASKRTAIRRLVKMILNTAIDLSEYQNQIIGSYNRTTEDEFINNDFKFSNTDDVKAYISNNYSVEEIEDDM